MQISNRYRPQKGFLFSISLSTQFVRFLNLRHSLIWRVDWLKIQAGMFAVVDPNDTGSILYLTESEYKSYWKVALSNSTLLAVLARPGETQPDDSVISAPKPNTPRSPSFYFRKARVYSRVAKALWGQMWTGGTVVPTSRNIGVLFKLWGNTLRLWTGLRVSSGSLSTDATQGVLLLQKIYKNNGAKGLVLYLKGSLLILNKFLAGKPVKSPWELGLAVSMTGGLPSWFPLAARHAIRQGSHAVIRLWTSILYTYKAYYSSGIPSIKTISSPQLELTPDVVELLSDFKSELPGILSQICPGDVIPINELKRLADLSKTPPLSTTAGPNGQSMKTAEVDAWLLLSSGQFKPVYKSIRRVLKKVYNSQELIQSLISTLKYLDGLAIHPSASERPLSLVKKRDLCVSRLAFLNEPAGKVRVIGILDYFSQWALRPMHKYLADLLRRITEDGTFDQSLAVSSFAFLTEGREGNFSSLDISAATDQIPFQLYILILDTLFGENKGRHIMSLLRERPFSLTKSKGKLPVVTGAVQPDSRVLDWYLDIKEPGAPHKDLPVGVFGGGLPPDRIKAIQKGSLKAMRASHKFPDVIRYTRGQPMGAYTSFPLLALVHHCIIQFCAIRSGAVKSGEWFALYRVLGDDSVIFDTCHTTVSSTYLDVCALFGIPINLTKSFQSDRMFNFASRTFFKGQEVSPAPLGGELAVTSVSRRVELGLSLIERGFGLSGKVHSSKNWMYALVRVLSSPLDYWLMKKHNLQEGSLNAITTRLLASALIPRERISLTFGLKALPVSAWVSSLRAEIRVIDSYESISIGDYTIETPMYRVWLMGIIALLYERYAAQVAYTILLVRKYVSRPINYEWFKLTQKVLPPGMPKPLSKPPKETTSGLDHLLYLRERSIYQELKPVSLERLNEFFDGQNFLSFLRSETRESLEKLDRLYLLDTHEHFLEMTMIKLFKIRDDYRKVLDLTIAHRTSMIENGVIILLDAIRNFPVLPDHFNPLFFEASAIKQPWFFETADDDMDRLHSLIIGLTSKVYNYSPEDPTGEASFDEIPTDTHSKKEGEFTAVGVGELFKL